MGRLRAPIGSGDVTPGGSRVPHSPTPAVHNSEPDPDGLLENIEGRQVTWAEVWASHSEVVSNAKRLGADGDGMRELIESSRPQAWKRWR